jgi:hypothetical protein
MVAAETSAGVAAVASDGMTKDEIRMRKERRRAENEVDMSGEE